MASHRRTRHVAPGPCHVAPGPCHVAPGACHRAATVWQMEPVYSSVIAFARGVFALQGLRFTINGVDNVQSAGGSVMAI